MQPCTLAAYAEAKGLPVEFLRGIGLSDMSYLSQPAIRVPYLLSDGTEGPIRFRVALHKGLGGSDERFRWKAGSKVQLYGLNRLATAQRDGTITLVEGESDAQTLWYHGEPAIGVPGSGNWRDNRDAGHLADIPIIYVVVEPDTGGATLLEHLKGSRLRDQMRIIHLGEYGDVSGLYLADSALFRERWERAKAESEALTGLLVREAQERRLRLAAEAEALAQQPDILADFGAAIRKVGVVGEERAAKLLYLAITSRLDSHPVSVVLKGPSSAGKSYVAAKVLQFFPEEAYYSLSSMSERALAYDDEPVSHRMIVIFEAAGLASDLASYLLRSLLSEGQIRYKTVIKTKDGLKPLLIVREGPTGAILTTTAIKMNPENETRLLSISISDSPAQTSAILLAHAVGEVKVEFTAWHSLQAWLGTGTVEAVIPFSADLARLIPPAAVRLRRDFPHILTLIRAHALLHQATRDLDASGRVIATVGEDYGAVRELVAELVAEGVELSVSAAVRETVAAVADILDGGATEATVATVGKEIGLDKSSASRRTRAAIDLGYLRNLEDRRGRPARLVMGSPLPEDVEILPTVARLQRGSEGYRYPPPLPYRR
jgi:hypothetical protein